MRSLTLTALDIGTSSVKGLCAQKNFRTGEVTLLAQSQTYCFGVRNGEVVKPVQVAEVIAKVRAELSEKASLRIKEALVNIGGVHLFSVASQGLVSVSRADQKVSREDIKRVIAAAQAVNLPSNKEVLNIFPKEFIVDGEGGIKDPLGLQGIRLEVKAVLVCLFSPILENLESALSEGSLQILEVFPSPLASARAVLRPEQKELGVCLVEIGAGTTSVSVFEKGDLIDFMIFPVGSANITNDIAIGLRTEIQTAERIKQEFGSLNVRPYSAKTYAKGKKGNSSRKSPSASDAGKVSRKRNKIEIPEKSLTVSKKFLKNVIEARVSEIFFEVQKGLKRISGGEPLPAGIILTGGGSKLPGIVEFAKQKLKLPCHLGSVAEIPAVEDPQFSTCAGLLLSGFDIGTPGKGEGVKVTGESVAGKFKRLFKVFLP